ncbi:10834_t:CDS:1 [Dentiscutata erythropus]|uniref:10834_t:CDS:1 n=1 Tax=Dentiscutata erythropus TaxID=1348616 RepID=A0A9N9C1P6_9GLOM|nr:10834_t:CDS:1 [Dentiscutata erythropus]
MINNCFCHTNILPVTTNKNTFINDDIIVYIDNNDILSKLQQNIDALHLQNTMNIDDFINYHEEDITNGNEILSDQDIVNLTNHSDEPQDEEEPDNSIEMCNYIHKEALDALDLITQYLLQQSDDMMEYIKMISKVSQATRNARNNSLQQANINSFFISSSNRDNEMIEEMNFMLEISEGSLLSNKDF